jgi:hypothetical protein
VIPNEVMTVGWIFFMSTQKPFLFTVLIFQENLYEVAERAFLKVFSTPLLTSKLKLTSELPGKNSHCRVTANTTHMSTIRIFDLKCRKFEALNAFLQTN